MLKVLPILLIEFLVTSEQFYTQSDNSKLIGKRKFTPGLIPDLRNLIRKLETQNGVLPTVNILPDVEQQVQIIRTSILWHVFYLERCCKVFNISSLVENLQMPGDIWKIRGW